MSLRARPRRPGRAERSKDQKGSRHGQQQHRSHERDALEPPNAPEHLRPSVPGSGASGDRPQGQFRPGHMPSSSDERSLARRLRPAAVKKLVGLSNGIKTLEAADNAMKSITRTVETM